MIQRDDMVRMMEERYTQKYQRLGYQCPQMDNTAAKRYAMKSALSCLMESEMMREVKEAVNELIHVIVIAHCQTGRMPIFRNCDADMLEKNL